MARPISKLSRRRRASSRPGRGVAGHRPRSHRARAVGGPLPTPPPSGASSGRPPTHAPLGASVTDVGRTDRGPAAADTTYLPPVYSILGGTIACDLPINAGPQHYVLNAALRQLARWVRTGRRPASTPPLSGRAGSPPILERDPRRNPAAGSRPRRAMA